MNNLLLAIKKSSDKKALAESTKVVVNAVPEEALDAPKVEASKLLLKAIENAGESDMGKKKLNFKISL